MKPRGPEDMLANVKATIAARHVDLFIEPPRPQEPVAIDLFADQPNP